VGLLAGATVMEKTGSDACSAPATKLITMFEYVPTSVAVGLPVTCPDQPNEAHCGRSWTSKCGEIGPTATACGVNA
jgi:hypothetical protein